MRVVVSARKRRRMCESQIPIASARGREVKSRGEVEAQGNHHILEDGQVIRIPKALAAQRDVRDLLVEERRDRRLDEGVGVRIGVDRNAVFPVPFFIEPIDLEKISFKSDDVEYAPSFMSGIPTTLGNDFLDDDSYQYVHGLSLIHI